MNTAVLLGGVLGTLFVAMFIFTAIVIGIREAFVVIGIVLAIVLSTAGLVLFWFWVAGGFA